MCNQRNQLMFSVLFAGLLIGCLILFSCTGSDYIYQTNDTIDFLQIDPGQSTVVPIGDIFFAKSYKLSFDMNAKIISVYDAESQELTLTPKQWFSGLTLIHFRNGSVPMVLPVIVSTKTEVKFQIAVDEKECKVFIMGNFNNWSRNSTPMSDNDGDGIYTASVFLPDGIYEYQFVIGSREIYDPENPEKVDNGFGYFNSLLHVQSENKLKIPNLYFLPGRDDSMIRLAVNSQKELSKRNITVLADNQLLPGENIHVNGNTLTIDLKNYPETSILRAVAAVDNKPGNVVTIWLNDGKPGSGSDDFIWQDAIVYSLMIDRFANGIKENDRPIKHPELNYQTNFYGGDFAGITRKIESGYFNDIGINTIWISPVNKTTDKAWREYPEPHRFYTGYHGYWPTSLNETEPRFGSIDELKQLVQTAHEHDLKVLLDFISNHIHVEHPYYRDHRDWFGSYELPDGTQNIRRFDEYRLTTWFDTFLPSFDYKRSPEAVEAMADNALWWLKETGVDGFRHDATKHVPYVFWRTLTKKINTEISSRRPLSVYQIGETFGGDDLIKSYVNNGMLSSQFNSNQYFILRRLFSEPDGNLNELKAAIDKSNRVYGDNNIMGNIIGSHDQVRIMALLEGDLTLAENGVERAFQEPPIIVDEYPTYLKERLLFCYLMTLPGIPIIYYGDEFGMTGANDPDNRRMMRFDNDLSEWETEQLRAFKQLTKLRNEYTCLRRGDYLNLYTDKDVMVYSRGDSDNRLIIAFNKGQEEKNITISPPKWMPIHSLEALIGTVDGNAGDEKMTLYIPALGYGILQIK